LFFFQLQIRIEEILDILSGGMRKVLEEEDEEDFS
jgi:hypothetical protein